VKRLALLAAGLALAAAPPADARDPIMPLAQVQPGMHCTGLTVVQGTTVSSFDADVIDVVAGIGNGPTPEILIRVSGPAVDVTGVGEGFSGSPIYCDDGHGTLRNVGGIGFGVGDFGNKLALATPIEAMLDQPITPPARVRRLSASERSSVRALDGPFTVSGLAPALARRLTAAARSSGKTVLTAPALARPFPVQTLRPGASLSAGYSRGDVAIDALGTVTYTDGNDVWGFAHPLDDAGRRNLLLQDAYVYTVVPNPNGDTSVSYKLGAAGHVVGTLTGDMTNGVTGLMGAPPQTTKLVVRARDGGGTRSVTTRTAVADELRLNSTGGISPLGMAAPLAVLDAAERVLRSEPGRTTARMCFTASVAFRAYPLHFCNRYVGDTALGGSGETIAADDVDAATALLESVQFRPPRVRAVTIDLDVQRGLDQAYILGVRAPGHVKAGHKLHVTVGTRISRGSLRRFEFDVKAPGNLAAGRYKLVVSGPGPDGSGGGGLDELLAQLFDATGGSDAGPLSYGDLYYDVAGLHFYDGLSARFVPAGPKPRGPGAKRRRPSKRIHAYRNRAYRIGGSASTPVHVDRP
jgi:hypothetical protein